MKCVDSKVPPSPRISSFSIMYGIMNNFDHYKSTPSGKYTLFSWFFKTLKLQPIPVKSFVRNLLIMQLQNLECQKVLLFHRETKGKISDNTELFQSRLKIQYIHRPLMQLKAYCQMKM